MPMIQVDLRRDLFQAKGEAISKAIHAGLIEGLDMPADDLFQVYRPHDEGEIVFSPDYGGADRRDLVLIRVTMVHMFPADVKARMYAAVVRHLEAAGVRHDDVLISVVEVGFDRASVTSVADALGVTHAALYRYISDRDAMMRAAMERVTAEHEWPELVDDWREVLWNEARGWWAFCERYPGFVTALASTPGMPAPMSKRMIRVSTHLHALGLSAGDALVALDLLMDTIHDIFHRADQRRGVIDGVITMSPEEVAEHLEGVPDDLVEVVINALIGDPWPWFSRKLDLVIDGIASHGA